MSQQLCVACEQPFDNIGEPFVAVCYRCMLRMRLANAAAEPAVAATEGRLPRAIHDADDVVRHPVLTQAIRDAQVITFIIGSCGEGSDHRAVETAFPLLPGDTLVVYRPGGS